MDRRAKLITLSLVAAVCVFISGPCPVTVRAQDAQPVVKFEVVSIKPTEDRFLQLVREGKNPIRIDDAQATLMGIDLSTVIQMAYQLPKYRVVLPRAATTSHFNIAGKVPAGATAAQVPQMLQSMLADRFNMAFHFEDRVQPVYFLTVGKGALKLKPSTAVDPSTQGCSIKGITYGCKGVTMAQVADELTKGYYLASAAQEQNLPAAAGLAEQWPDRPVIDKTGFTGAFDFTADFGKPNSDNKAAAASADESDTVSAFLAIKSLGLVLQPDKQPVQVLVVDHIDEPTPN